MPPCARPSCSHEPCVRRQAGEGRAGDVERGPSWAVPRQSFQGWHGVVREGRESKREGVPQRGSQAATPYKAQHVPWGGGGHAWPGLVGVPWAHAPASLAHLHAQTSQDITSGWSDVRWQLIGWNDGAALVTSSVQPLIRLSAPASCQNLRSTPPPYPLACLLAACLPCLP